MKKSNSVIVRKDLGPLFEEYLGKMVIKAYCGAEMPSFDVV